MGNAVTEIGADAFRKCYDLSSITLSSKLISIGTYAFSDCTSLRSIVLPSTLESIGASAFSNCTSLSGITINAKKLNNCSSTAYTFADAGKNAPNGLAVSFGSEVTRIPQYLFNGYSTDRYPRIKTVKIGSSVKEIGQSAFRNCAELESVELPKSVETVKIGAFAGCEALKKLVVFNANCSIYSYESTLGVPTATVIYGYRSSTAQNYASQFGYSFLPIDPFNDVKPGTYYCIPVFWAYYHDPQITGGTDATHFGPGKDCTREQIVTFLWKAVGAPNPKTDSSPFSDVKKGSYYYKAVLWAVENNITGGVGDGSKFGVGQKCKREQAVTFIWKANGAPNPRNTSSPFSDVKPGSYYYKAVLWAVENNITGGVGDGKFGVGRSCTRGQIVTFLYKVDSKL